MCLSTLLTEIRYDVEGIHQHIGIPKRLYKVESMKRKLSEAQANNLSVKLELQADFLAGFWAARSAQNTKLTEADIKSALTAANAIGDDKLQKESQGYVVPDAFTHGTSAQRMEWFMRGFKAKSIDEGNTFELVQ